MNKQSNKSAYTFFGIAIIALAVLAGGWFYLQSQNTTIKVESDKPAYFTTDKPVVEVKLLNKKEANTGEIGLKFTQDILTVTDTQVADGVTLRNLEDEYVFELSDEYFSDDEETVATLTFESVEQGKVNFELDKELSSLSNSEGPMEVAFEDLTVEVGEAPNRGERESQGETGEYNSL